jgi:hypothetical protein
VIDRWLTDVAERVVRIIIVAVAATALAFGAGQVFGEFVSTLLIAPLLPALVALLGPRRWYLRVPLHGLALTAAMAGAVALEGDQIIAGTRDAVVDGVGQLVSTEWPSPRFATLVAVATGLLGVTTALAVEAARSRRWRVLPVLPLAACAGAIVAASAPAGA